MLFIKYHQGQSLPFLYDAYLFMFFLIHTHLHVFPRIGNALGPGISLYGRALAHASVCCTSWCCSVDGAPCKSARWGHAAAVAVELCFVFSLLIITRFPWFLLLVINGVNLLFNSRTKKLRDELMVSVCVDNSFCFVVVFAVWSLIYPLNTRLIGISRKKRQTRNQLWCFLF